MPASTTLASTALALLVAARAALAATSIQSPALYQCTPAAFQYECECVTHLARLYARGRKSAGREGDASAQALTLRLALAVLPPARSSRARRTTRPA